MPVNGLLVLLHCYREDRVNLGWEHTPYWTEEGLRYELKVFSQRGALCAPHKDLYYQLITSTFWCVCKLTRYWMYQHKFPSKAQTLDLIQLIWQLKRCSCRVGQYNNLTGASGSQSLQPDMSGPYDHHVFVLTRVQGDKSHQWMSSTSLLCVPSTQTPLCTYCICMCAYASRLVFLDLVSSPLAQFVPVSSQASLPFHVW